VSVLAGLRLFPRQAAGRDASPCGSSAGAGRTDRPAPRARHRPDRAGPAQSRRAGRPAPLWPPTRRSGGRQDASSAQDQRPGDRGLPIPTREQGQVVPPRQHTAACRSTRQPVCLDGLGRVGVRPDGRQERACTSCCGMALVMAVRGEAVVRRVPRHVLDEDVLEEVEEPPSAQCSDPRPFHVTGAAREAADVVAQRRRAGLPAAAVTQSGA
jgi:hypothetical protein